MNGMKFTAGPHTRIVLTMAALGLIAALAIALGGCAEDPGGEPLENLPPNVWLASAPPEGTDARYRIQLYWGGWDPDGEIAYYEYCITDNAGAFDPADTTGPDKWDKVTGNDSLFTFSADIWADSNATDQITRFERSHTFFIRAIDEHGAPSLEPAYRSFTSWTLSPEVRIQVPRTSLLAPARVPSITTYQWNARDYVNSELEIQDPDSVRHILVPVESGNYAAAVEYIRTHPDDDLWSEWKYYKAENDSGKKWTTPPIDLGTYVFAAQAKDEAGAVTPVFDQRTNYRRVRVSRRSTGPQLDVYNEFTGTIRTTIANTSPVIIDLPAGVPVMFSFSADADSYGGLVSGYRYGWDIGDVSDPDQWEIDYTPFTRDEESTPSREFYYGSHTFNLEVIDNNGAVSRVEVKINYVQFTMRKGLLLVDDFAANGSLGTTNGAVPSDAELDAFWTDQLSGLAGFDPVADVITAKLGSPLSIVKFSDYKSVIWDAFGNYNAAATSRPKLYDLIQFRSQDPNKNPASGKIQPNLLALFLRAGGHVLLCGNQPLSQVINPAPVFFSIAPRFPLIFKYELEGDQDGEWSDQVDSENFVGDKSFAYEDVCLNAIDIAYTGYASLRNRFDNPCGDRYRTTPKAQGEGLREAKPIDPSFPLLTLRPEVAGPGKAYAPEQKGLNSELYNPVYFENCSAADIPTLRDCFEPVYAHVCLDTTSLLYQYEAPVAFWSSRYADLVPQGPPDGIAARSFFMGVEPFYFNPSQVREMMEIILFDEWQLPRL
jgi:hypothetical protein